MDDLTFGTRNARGDWSPGAALETNPLLALPPNLGKVLRWIPGYFLPWNALFFVLGLMSWLWLTPSTTTMKTLAPGWILWLFARNAMVVLVIYGSLEWRLYRKRGQGTQFKYNGRWPAEQANKGFLFQSQTIDNMIRTFGSGIPIWTAYEVFGLWCYSNGRGPWRLFAGNQVWLVGFALVLPVFHEVHFYCIHRLIHVPFLYRHVHAVHHQSINPTPWSSLSMHPVEHLLYWSDCLIHLLLPSHPLLFLYHLNITGTGAVVGHVGFDRIIVGGQRGIDTHSYAHYLHHKYFRVNYADGTTALDKLFGSWHDGTAEADRAMRARHKEKVAKLGARRARSLDESAPAISDHSNETSLGG